MNETAYEVKIITGPQNDCVQEIIRQVLISFGFRNTDIIELSENGKVTLSLYATTFKKAKDIKSAINNLGLSNAKLHVRSLRKSQWLTKWKDDFRPFGITKKYGIVPAWMKGEFKFKNKEPIYIDTTLAFGTGLHPTTKFVAGFIERLCGKFESFFDVGTGTGILSILAQRYGATEILAIDISKDSVKCAKENFLLNGMKYNQLKAVDFSILKNYKKFDFLAANLTSQDLIRLSRKVVSFVKPNKFLAVSGISLSNYKKVKDEFKKFHLKCLKQECHEGWSAFLFKKEM